MAKALNCQEGPTPSPCNVCPSCHEITSGVALDVIEIDGASNRGINEIRELRENVKYMPSRGRFKIYIIDEVHMLTTEAFNALLKTLEEPPAHVLFFFATTEPQKIPITILSRCQRHNFRRIALADIVGCLTNICRDLSFQISHESLHMLAREATGGLRDALSLLDQVMAYAGGRASDEEVLQSLGVIDQSVLFELSGAIFDGNVTVAIDLLEKLYAQGHDMKRLYGQMQGHLRQLLLVKMNRGKPELPDTLEEDILSMQRQTQRVSLEFVNQIFTTWFDAETTIRFASQPKLALEILFIKLAQLKNIVSFDSVLERLHEMTNHLEDGASPSPVVKTAKKKQAKTEPRRSSQDENPSKVVERYSASLGQTWNQLLSVFQEKCKLLLPSLEKASLKKIGEDFIEITIQGNSFFADRLRDKKNQETVQEICSEFFGKKMELRLKEKREDNISQKKRDETKNEKRLKREALEHPVVTEALEIFEGRLVDVKIHT
jgi:DNA polymerase-3 subunit gamma/tau